MLQVILWLLLMVLWWTCLATVVLILRHGKHSEVWQLLIYAAGVAVAVPDGAALDSHGIAAITAALLIPWALMRGTDAQHIGLVWLKRRLRRRGKPLGQFWEHVSDDYYWRAGRQPDDETPQATELESAEAPAGRGTEPEASPAPTGRGSELEPAGLDSADSETDADRGGRAAPRCTHTRA